MKVYKVVHNVGNRLVSICSEAIGGLPYDLHQVTIPAGGGPLAAFKTLAAATEFQTTRVCPEVFDVYVADAIKSLDQTVGLWTPNRYDTMQADALPKGTVLCDVIILRKKVA